MKTKTHFEEIMKPKDGYSSLKLLFVTNEKKLESAIGVTGVIQIRKLIKNHVYIDLQIDEIAQINWKLYRKILQDQGIDGVVILGGYTVLPAYPKDVKQESSVNREVDAPDLFVVWTDDLYGYAQTSHLPVSRIPDCSCAEVMLKALTCQSKLNLQKAGIRNYERPYADNIYATNKRKYIDIRSSNS
jgi:hypothetical protein